MVDGGEVDGRDGRGQARRVSARVTRTVLHVDMDAFYVSVELRRRPELAGLPVVVGGDGSRGVVAAASYEARRYGVHSAMSSVVARRRCPQAVFLPGDHAHYAEVSRQVRSVLDRFTPLVEPLSLDEAFLDVTGSIRLFGSGVGIGHRIRAEIHDELGLDCSVGVATNKFLAKLASVEAKPHADATGVRPGAGVVEVVPGRELEFLHPLPVERLWGVGPKTLERLQRLGVTTVGDLAGMDEANLVGRLGRGAGRHLAALARGIDDRPVEADRAVKSIGHEETFARDRFDHDELGVELVRLADGVASRLRRAGLGGRTLSLKVRFTDFRTITRSVTLERPVDGAGRIVDAVRPLLEQLDVSTGVRLLGVSAHNLGPPVEQLDLFDQGPAASRADDTVDRIRDRFGPQAIAPASSVGDRGIRVVRPGAQQWGPDGSR